MVKDRIILGMDPGTSIMGYGILEILKNKPSVIATGIIDLRNIKDHYIKIKMIYDRTIGLIDEYHPDELAIEAPFYGNNVQSMLKLGRAQGAAISAALNRSMPIKEYAPRRIKLAITGNGNASKEQVAGILQKILKIKDIPKELDATDGIAAALCHYFQSGRVEGGKKSNHWESFVKNNPDRVL